MKTKQELIDYFKWLAEKYGEMILDEDVNVALKACGKWLAYSHAVHVLERELEDENEH